VAALTVTTSSQAQPNGQAADLILHNGVVWTVNETQATAEAVAIRGERLVAVGTNEDALARRGPATRVIDLQGAFLMPGFNDTHVHFGSASAFYEFNIMRTATQEQFVARVEELVRQLPAGEWITGGLWGAYDEWAPDSAGGETRTRFTPDMSLVAQATRHHPVFIQRFDRSEFAVNAAALEAAGLDPEGAEHRGIEFVRDDTGRFTGLLRGSRVARLFQQVVPQEMSTQRRLQRTRRALRMIAEAGVTNVSDMSDDRQLEIYRQLRAAGELTVRVHFRYPLDRWSELAEAGIRTGSGDPWIRLGSLKGHIDGIMGTSSARFFEPYDSDPDNRGSWRRLMVDQSGRFVEGQFLQYMLDADRAGLQLTIHAIGDEANHLLLEYLDELNRQNGPRDRRFRLVHAQVIAPQDFQRLGPLGIIAEVQPYHLSDDMRWMEERIGTERCRGAYAFRSIERSGARLCFGTDWPGTSAAEYPIDPMLGLYAAVTRQTVTGQPSGGWFPAERITIERAIRAYTADAAYANFEEDLKGTIEVGKLADIVVLSEDLTRIAPGRLPETKVLYTVVGGRVVYARD
jgi:predicted amidohydrolase YtcJ